MADHPRCRELLSKITTIILGVNTPPEKIQINNLHIDEDTLSKIDYVLQNQMIFDAHMVLPRQSVHPLTDFLIDTYMESMGI